MNGAFLLKTKQQIFIELFYKFFDFKGRQPKCYRLMNDNNPISAPIRKPGPGGYVTAAASRFISLNINKKINALALLLYVQSELVLCQLRL